MDRSHGGRVSHESDAEVALSEAMGDALAEAAWPGVFAGGKQIIATAAYKDPRHGDVLNFTFDDGTQMNIVGQFSVRYRSKPTVAEAAEAEATAIRQGHELMSGETE